MSDDQFPDLTWREKVPIATRFDDPYFSLEDGLAETEYVFLGGNNLPDRFHDGFHVAELGFGTGLNFLVTWQAWRRAGVSGVLRFTSFELFPMKEADMLRALSGFPALGDLSRDMVDGLAGGYRFEGEDVELDIVVGDARETVRDWDRCANAWYLDGFAPARNPELWESELLREVARHTKRGGSAATYSAAGFIRRSLQEAGFDVERRPGFGRKRHMTVAHKP